MANNLEHLIYDLPEEWQEKAHSFSDHDMCSLYCESINVVGVGDYINHLENRVETLENKLKSIYNECSENENW